MRAKQLSAIALAVAATAVGSGVASAAQPDRVPVPPDPVSFDAGTVCAFPVLFTFDQQGEKIAFFSDGRARLTGVSKPRITNLATGKSIVVNASGPGWLDRNASEGVSVFVLSPADVGGPGIYVTRGKVTATRDDNGFFTSITTTGRVSGNLCDALA